MFLNPFNLGSTASQANSTQAYNNSQLNQLSQRQQYSQTDLAQQAAASRAKRLDSLFTGLTNLLEQAVVNNLATHGPDIINDYLDYALARLNGNNTGDLPEGLEDYANELEQLISDIVAAWDALLSSGDLNGETDTTQIQSFGSVLEILERIANRRLEAMMANNLYAQWRDLYRNGFDQVKDNLFTEGSEATRSLPAGVTPAVAQAIVDGDNSTISLDNIAILSFLQTALSAKREGGAPVLNEDLQARVAEILDKCGCSPSQIG